MWIIQTGDTGFTPQLGLRVLKNVDGVNFVYNIDASTHATTGLMTGYWSDYTQIIGNNLPLWHAGRYSDTSNYQQLLNTFEFESL